MLALLCASRDGVSLPVSPAGLGVVQDGCGSQPWFIWTLGVHTQKIANWGSTAIF